MQNKLFRDVFLFYLLIQGVLIFLSHTEHFYKQNIWLAERLVTRNVIN